MHGPEPGPPPPAGRRGRRLVWVLLPVAVAVLAVALWMAWRPFAAECRRIWWRWMAVPGTVGIFATSDGQCVLVSQVNRKEPGPSSSSLRPGDRIVEVDGVSVMTLEDVAERLKERWAGEIVRFAIDRDGARLDLGVELLPRR